MSIKPNIFGQLGRQQNCSIKYEIIQQKIPAREASHQFMARVRLQVNKTDQFEKESEDN